MDLVDRIVYAREGLLEYRNLALNQKAIYRYEGLVECLDKAYEQLLLAEQEAVGLWNHTPKRR